MVETPADAFAVLGSEVRVEILRSVAAEVHPGYAQPGVRFSEIQAAVSIDDAGQLNYHLDKLRGHFLQRTDDGYRLRQAGWEVLRVIEAGTFHEQGEQSFDAPGTCYACGAPGLEARTEREWFAIDCSECDTAHTAHPLPPWLLRNGDPEQLFRALDADVRHRAAVVADHRCPECLGDTTVTIRDDAPSEWDIGVIPQFRCTNCRYWFHPPFGLLALTDPAVVEFFKRHGENPTGRPYWDLSVCVSPDHLTVTSQDPWRVDHRVKSGGKRLCVTFDGGADIRETVVDP